MPARTVRTLLLILLAAAGIALPLLAYLRTTDERPAIAEAQAAARGEGWVCAMHCEPGRVFPRPGSCPVCRMVLDPWARAPYGAVARPMTGGGGAPGRVGVALELVDPSGVPVRRLETAPGGEPRAVAVTPGLDELVAVQAGVSPTGAILLSADLRTPGLYTLLCEFTPAGEPPRSVSTTFAVPGSPVGPEPELEDDTAMLKHAGDYTVRFRCNGGAFFSEADSFLRYSLELNGEVATDVEPCSDEIGPLVLVNADRTRVLRARRLGPNEKSPAGAALRAFNNYGVSDFNFHVVLPDPGLYRALARFRRGEQVLTVLHTLEVLPGGPGAAGQVHDHASHQGRGPN